VRNNANTKQLGRAPRRAHENDLDSLKKGSDFIPDWFLGKRKGQKVNKAPVVGKMPSPHKEKSC